MPLPADALPAAPRQVPPPRPAHIPPGLPPVLWADEHLLVIDKPSGLLSVPGKGEAGADNALTRVQTRWPQALVVHRLDMGTSGLLVFGLSPQAQRQLSRSFEARAVDKVYQALVAGVPTEPDGEINLPLVCDWPNRPRQMVDHSRGKPALTRWQRLSTEGPHGRLALYPVTGRSHQLRVHLQALGHPIVGDELYAPPEVVAASPRLCLHAWRLSLPHPAHGERLTLEAPLPF